MSDDTFKAPNFVGQTYADAQRTAENVDLKLAEPTKKPCDGQPKGSVCEQDPKAGTEVKKGDTISLVVSTGAPKVQVPVWSASPWTTRSRSWRATPTS